MASNTNVKAPTFTPEGRTSDGRYVVDVLEYAAVCGISPATAWRYVRSGRIRSIQPAGPNGRRYVPVHAVLAELGIATAAFEEVER